MAAELSRGEMVCLSLIEAGLDHGWAIGSALAPDGSVGRVWALSRSLTYRAIDQLALKGLVRRAPAAPKGARERRRLACTAAGRRAVRQWLDEPVEHVRDVRTELLLKLVLRQQRGVEIESLLRAQRARFSELFSRLTAVRGDDDLVELWRRESARAVRRFLDMALDDDRGCVADVGPRRLPLSARNQLPARVATVHHGEVMTTVRAALAGGDVITAVITRDSANELDLAPDDAVLVVVKSTEVMLAKQ